MKHTLILWIAPPFGGSPDSSLGHGDEMEVEGLQLRARRHHVKRPGRG
jgi:hypothetical protein